MNQAACRSIRFRGRSFEALALEPEAPLSSWIDRLDIYLANFPSFFSYKPIVVDVTKLQLDRAEAAELVKNLHGRGIRIIGLAGADPGWSGEDLPPILPKAREPATVDAAKEARSAAKGLSAEEQAAFEEIANALAKDGQAPPAAPSEAPLRPNAAAPLVVNSPVRSGQTI